MSTAPPASGVPGGAALRVLTLNAHQGFTALKRRNVLSEIRDGLRASAADLVFLQEIGGSGLPEGPEQYEVLADQAWPQHAYGRNAVTTRGHHGNALLSRHPIVDWHNFDLSVVRREARGALHCVVDVPGQAPLHAICVHLGLVESERRQQLDRLLGFVAATVPPTAPLIVAGDFNDWRSRAHNRLVAETPLREVHASAAGCPARTFPASFPLLRLDRIYVRHLGHRPLALPRRPWSGLSDHLPLAAEVWFADVPGT